MPEILRKGYTEVPTRSSEETITEEEKATLLENQPTLKRFWERPPRIAFWLTQALLLVSNLSLLVGLVYFMQTHDAKTEVSWLPPKVSTKKLFVFETLYGEPLSPNAEKAWNELMPVGRGFVTIKNETALPDQPGLDQSLPEQRAMVAVFHQLHCLYMTREAYYTAREGNVDQVSVAHLMHCWDYLRQTIMCSADTTLEWLPAPPNDKGSTGWGFEHTCNDFDTIAQWAEENRVKTTHGIH
ncbi:hypothetical protein BDV26DRAFT_289956 [Aspergillus bertholletiae]|uniref:Tat pathway signal sequence n=1 Tax=Aspergillus bertholletiae TaxID=1226010 RepID=A0A5N7BGN0_9EURO|nr:hypothetical protein BDV26DRAFT_289956 [Aspergillus bertholletiae]